MLDRQEKVWEYDAVEAGQGGRPTVVAITEENIAAYALVAQNRDARYRTAELNLEYGGSLVAMPTMALTYAPLLRDDIAANNGFVALEDSKTARCCPAPSKSYIPWDWAPNCWVFPTPVITPPMPPPSPWAAAISAASRT